MYVPKEASERACCTVRSKMHTHTTLTCYTHFWLVLSRPLFFSFRRRNPVRGGTDVVGVRLCMLLVLGCTHGFFSFSAASCNALGFVGLRGHVARVGLFGSGGVAFFATGKLYDNGSHVVFGSVP